MGASRRQKQSGVAMLIEGCTVGGGAVGLYLTSQHLLHHPVRPAPCPSARDAATCLSHATNLAVTPMAEGGLTGAFLGLIVAAALILLWRHAGARGVVPRVAHPSARVRRGRTTDCG